MLSFLLRFILNQEKLKKRGKHFGFKNEQINEVKQNK
jgi:hypothetical protein